MPLEPGRRRRPDMSAAFELVLSAPLVLSSLIVMALLGQLLMPRLPWLLPVVWLLSGAIVFISAIDVVFANVILRVRRPSPAEQSVLVPLWHEVCAVAGVRPERYTLWIQNSREINALAAAGHVVAVSTAALGLPPAQLEAVLAHELGHHLSGHSVASLLRWWYVWPARLAATLVGFVIQIVLVIGQVFLRFGNVIVAMASVVVALLLVVFLFAASPWLLLVPVIAPLLALTSRQAELRADRVAAELGYGPPLLDVLHRWVREGHDEVRDRAGFRARMLASHPSCGDRIRRLEGRA